MSEFKVQIIAPRNRTVSARLLATDGWTWTVTNLRNFHYMSGMCATRKRAERKAREQVALWQAEERGDPQVISFIIGSDGEQDA